MSYPRGITQGGIGSLGEETKTGRHLSVRQVYGDDVTIQRWLRGIQDSKIPCPGNRLRTMVDVEFAVDIAGVHLDCVQ